MIWYNYKSFSFAWPCKYSARFILPRTTRSRRHNFAHQNIHVAVLDINNNRTTTICIDNKN